MMGFGASNPFSRDSNSSQHWTGCAPCLLNLQRERSDKSVTLGRLTCAQLSLAPTPPSSDQLEAIQPPKPHRPTHNFQGIRIKEPEIWADPRVLWRKAPRAMRAMRGKTLETVPFQPYFGCTKGFLKVLSSEYCQATESYESKTGL